MPNINKLDVSLVDKFLSARETIHVRTAKNIKSAVLSYVLFPNFFSETHSYYQKAHSNRLLAKVISNVLLSIGYNVEIFSYMNSNPQVRTVPEIFIGHNISFHAIASRLPKATKKILILSGASPDYDNAAIQKRLQGVADRKHLKSEIPFKPRISDFARRNFEIADHILVIGGDSGVASTWFHEYQTKIISINNLYQFHKNVTPKVNGKSFVCVASENAFRRGLDLVLDAIAEIPEATCTICGPYKNEESFMEIYGAQIYSSKQINALNVVNLSSKRFAKAIRSADFCILPSCSEGQSGSILNLMSLGLVPVMTKQCGFLDIEKFGFEISNGTVHSVREAMQRALRCSKKDILQKKSAVKSVLQYYSPNYVGMLAYRALPLFERWTTSQLGEGATATLLYANRIVELPQQLIISGIASSIFPMFSQLGALGNIAEINRLLSKASRYILFLYVPLALLLCVYGLPVIRLIFERGEFTLSDAQNTFDVFSILILSLPAMGLCSIIGQCYYVHKNTKIVAVIGLLETLVFVATVWALVGHLKILALPIGYFALYSFAVLVNSFILERNYKYSIFRSTFRSSIKPLISTAIAFGLVSSLTRIFPAHPDNRILSLYPLILSLTCYLFVQKVLFKSEELGFFYEVFSRKAKKVFTK